ncbi:MAG: FadR family transcriptional regulator [bacterium]|nr:FadR family transcriptional regulator [bacterium]
MNDPVDTTISLPSFKRNNLVEMVFESLKENILNGTLEEDKRLPNQEVLARQFGVSRTVIREALNKLSSLGFIESHQGRGTFVRSPDAKSVMSPIFDAILTNEVSTREIVETRYYLEGIIGRRAAQRATPEDVAELETLIARMEKHLTACELTPFCEGDLAFHLLLARISNNGILTQLLEAIREMMFNFMDEISRLPGVPEKAMASHKIIFQAVAEHNNEQAEYEMRHHMLLMIEALQEQFQYEFEL